VIQRLKKAIYIFNRLTQVFIGPLVGGHYKTCLLVPPVDLSDELELEVRMAWYVPRSLGIKVMSAVSNGKSDLKQTDLPEWCRTDIDRNGYIERCSGSGARKLAKKRSTLILIHKVCMKALLQNIFRLHRVRIIDRNFYLFSESHTSAALVYYDFWSRLKRKHLMRHSLAQIQWAAKEKTENIVTLVATGPSAAEHIDARVADKTDWYICNSVVKDRALVEKLRPRFVFAGDSAFHFGTSRYCQAFESDLVHCLSFGTIYCLNPVGAALFHAQWDLRFPSLVNNVIALPAKRFGRLQMPTQQEFVTSDTQNVMTRYMLPVAQIFYKHIRCVGFDGKPATGESDYFWRHSERFQYDKTSVLKAHPTFFSDIDYDVYYETHTRALTERVNLLREAGSNISSVTPTHLKVLNES